MKNAIDGNFRGRTNLHFSGIGGVGMSALAQLVAMEGKEVTGSDRDFDRARNLDVKGKLEALGIKIFPQDGSGVNSLTASLALSTAIEDSNPEVLAARAAGLPVIHRSELLADYVNRFNTVAVAGTSGKSTTVGMLFTILEGAGLGPSVITGGALCSLKDRGLVGNAFKGTSDLLVVEADESDGTITRYKPKTGLLLNITKDHKDVDELKKIFGVFAADAGKIYFNPDDSNSAAVVSGGIPFGFNSVKYKVSDVILEAFSSRFSVNGVPFRLPVPGRYNIENALAAVAVAADMGVSLQAAAAALAGYKGVDRRFHIVGEKRGVTVIDDYAHNPAKIAAVLKAVHQVPGRRVFAVYQPHGFTPTRHLKNELIESLAEGLGPEDILVMPEIYYAGGTVTKNISSKDLVDEVSRRGRKALFFEQRRDIPGALAPMAKSGDTILVMGARDATLSEFAEEILKKL